MFGVPNENGLNDPVREREVLGADTNPTQTLKGVRR